MRPMKTYAHRRRTFVTQRCVLALVSLIGGRSAFCAEVATPTRWNLGGTGGWDDLTVDVRAHRLYVTRSDRVLVVDTKDGTLIGTIPDTNGVHGVAIDAKAGKGYTSNGRADSVTEFDLKSLKIDRVIPVSGHNPDAIVFDASTNQVWTFNGRSSDATAIDTRSGLVVATLPLGGKPEFAAVDGHGRIFVNDEDHATIIAIDSKAHRVAATWKLDDCESPSGLAFDAGHHRLFSACSDEHMAVTDSESGRHVATVPIGKGPDGAAYDPERRVVYSPNGRDGTLSVIRQIDADHYEVVATLKTQQSARTMTLDTTTHALYLPAATLGPAPAPTAEQPHPRPSIVPDTFCILVVSPGAIAQHKS